VVAVKRTPRHHTCVERERERERERIDKRLASFESNRSKQGLSRQFLPLRGRRGFPWSDFCCGKQLSVLARQEKRIEEIEESKFGDSFFWRSMWSSP